MLTTPRFLSASPLLMLMASFSRRVAGHIAEYAATDATFSAS